MPGVLPLFSANGSSFDCLNVAESVPQKAATETHGLQIFSAGDGVAAATPTLRELLTGKKANEDLLADVLDVSFHTLSEEITTVPKSSE